MDKSDIHKKAHSHTLSSYKRLHGVNQKKTSFRPIYSYLCSNQIKALAMRNQINSILDNLRVKFKQNLEEINKNQQSLQTILKNSDEYGEKFEAYITKNKQLLVENNDLLNVQSTLNRFLGKYGDTSVFSDISADSALPEVDEQELFEDTVDGSIRFDESHPMYSEPQFVDKLIEHYEGNEDYELCNGLKGIKEKMTD